MIQKYIPSGENSVVIVVVFLIFAISIVLWVLYIKGLMNEPAVCTNINNLYVPAALTSINTTDTYNHPVNFYYIKTAFNCCSGGNYANSYVNLCILEKIITQGVRCFDFGIYNINENAVISTSLVNNFMIKETINYVFFSDAIETIVTQAFSSNYCTNYQDPVFLSLRINSNDINVYNNIASTLSNYSDVLLLNKYSVKNTDNFCSSVILSDLMKKIVIMVYSTSIELQNSNLMEFINVITGPSTPYFNYEPYSTLSAGQTGDTIEFTKEKTMFVTPNVENGIPINPDPTLCFATGVQFIGMSYQYLDNSLQAYQAFFDKYKHAFVLKNSLLLPTKTIIKIPVPGEDANPNKCHEVKTQGKVVGNYGSGCTD